MALIPSRTPAFNPALLSRIPPSLWSNPNVRAMFPGLLGPDSTGATPTAPGWSLQNRGNIPNYAAVLRPAVAAGLSGIPLTETLSRAADSEAAKRGLDPTLRDAVMAVPALQNIQDAFNLADALEQTRVDIVGYRESGTKDVNGPSRIEAGLSGAASGAAAGSVVPGYGTAIGAGVGLVAGVLGGGKKQEGTADEYRKRAANAEAQIEAPGVQAALAGLVPDVREQTMISGEASGAQTAFQAALSRSGLRDSALGSLAGIASAAIPDQMARVQTLQLGLTTTRRRVEELLGGPVRGTQPGSDRLTEALGAVANGFLAFRSLFPQKGAAPSNTPFIDPETPYNTPADVGEATSGG